MSEAEDLDKLAREIEVREEREWEEVVIGTTDPPGKPHHGSSYWDGRHAAFEECAQILRAAAAQVRRS